MILRCTLYRRTPKGLKVIGRKYEAATLTSTGLRVEPRYFTELSGNYELVHGFAKSTEPDREKLLDLGIYRLGGGSVTVFQDIEILL